MSLVWDILSHAFHLCKKAVHKSSAPCDVVSWQRNAVQGDLQSCLSVVQWPTSGYSLVGVWGCIHPFTKELLWIWSTAFLLNLDLFWTSLYVVAYWKGSHSIIITGQRKLLWTKEVENFTSNVTFYLLGFFDSVGHGSRSHSTVMAQSFISNTETSQKRVWDFPDRNSAERLASKSSLVRYGLCAAKLNRCQCCLCSGCSHYQETALRSKSPAPLSIMSQK